jgi:glutaconate CoA-transferase subunit A
MLNQVRKSALLPEEKAGQWVKSGMTIAIGEPAPMGLLRWIIRNKITDLTVIGSGMALDYLIAGGCVRKVVTYYAGSPDTAVMPAFRSEAENGSLEVWECEEGILTSGLEAAGKGLPFMPWRGGVGTSLPDINADLKVIRDPIGGEVLIAVPAIDIDITLLHASISDSYGNVQHCRGTGWLDMFLYRAADRVIVQVEKIVSNEEIRSKPWETTISNADAIVLSPYGAHPFYSRGYYVQDQEYIQAYLEAIKAAYSKGSRDDKDDYFETHCNRFQSHAEYLDAIGMGHLISLSEY